MEAERARVREQDRLESARLASLDWEQELAAQMARNKLIWEAQYAAAAEAERVAEEGARAAREWAERMEQLEAEAERVRRPWWRRFR